MPEPTGPARDSSLRINKAPGKCYSCREAQIAATNIVRQAHGCQWQSALPGRARLPSFAANDATSQGD